MDFSGLNISLKWSCIEISESLVADLYSNRFAVNIT